MSAKITRRALAPGLAAQLSLPAALAQQAAVPPKEDPAQLLEMQRAQQRRNAEQLANFKLQQSDEPSFRFEA